MRDQHTVYMLHVHSYQHYRICHRVVVFVSCTECIRVNMAFFCKTFVKMGEIPHGHEEWKSKQKLKMAFAHGFRVGVLVHIFLQPFEADLLSLR